MNGIHDMGGMHGFGRVEVEPDEPVFHAAWERRTFGMMMAMGWLDYWNVDAFRHAIEKVPAVRYLGDGYYGRWLLALERLLVDAGLLAADEVEARRAGRPPETTPRGAPAPSPRAAGAQREVDRPPRFRAGQAVVARDLQPAGHTRLPGYARRRRGVVARVYPAWVFPDTNAHDRGENPQHVYAVGFAAAELWGAGAEPNATIHVDLFESYLEPDDRDE